jgi:hypothetical protein
LLFSYGLKFYDDDDLEEAKVIADAMMAQDRENYSRTLGRPYTLVESLLKLPSFCQYLCVLSLFKIVSPMLETINMAKCYVLLQGTREYV